MANLLDNEVCNLEHVNFMLCHYCQVEQISKLSALADSMVEYYRRCVDVMESLQSTLEGRISEASSRIPREKLDPTMVVKESPKYTQKRSTMRKKR